MSAKSETPLMDSYPTSVVEREINEALHPVGMSVHSGKVRLPCSHVQNIIARARSLERDRARLVEVLELSNRLMQEALPKFNWGASCLDANAITLLNEVPGAVRALLAELEERK